MRTNACLVLLLMFLFAGTDCLFAEASHDPVIRIGAIVSLSGDAAKKGHNWLEGAELAVDHLSQENIRVKLIVEDDGTSPKRVIDAFNKLASADRVQGIIGGTWDFLAETAFPLSKRYQIPFITPTNPIEVLSDTFHDNPYAFTNGLSLAAERSAIEHFLRTQNVGSLSVVYVNVPYGTSHAELVKKVAVKQGLEITSKHLINYQSYLDDLRLAALKISNKRPDMVFLVVNYSGADIFLRELSKLNYHPVVLMTQALDEAFKLSDSPKLYNKAFGVYPDITDHDFISKFKGKYNHPPKDYAVSGYDALMFLARGLHSGNKLQKTGTSFTYSGVTGVHKLPCFRAELVSNSAVIMTTRDGKFEKYDPK